MAPARIDEPFARVDAPTRPDSIRLAGRVVPQASTASWLEEISSPKGAGRAATQCRVLSKLPYSIDFSINPRVLAFSTRVRTLARSSPDGTSASISSLSFTSLPGSVVNCSTIASTI